MQPLIDLSTLLANPPGNLVYILAITFTLISAMQGAISQLRTTGLPQMRRLIFGLGLLLGFQVFLFLFSALAGQNIFNGSALLPVLDRAGLLFCLVWVIWLWAFPDSSQYGDAGTGLLSLLVVAAGIFGMVVYASGSPDAGTFNISAQVDYWDFGAVLILALGIAILFLRKSEAWGTGIGMLLVAMLGFLLDMFFPAQKGDYSGVVRFFILAAYPLLLILPNRYFFKLAAPARPLIQDSNDQEPGQEPVLVAREPIYEEHSLGDSRERRRYSTDAKTLQSLFALAADTDVDKANRDIVRGIAQALLVDLCLLIYIGEDKVSLSVATGYDLIREENIEGGMINRESVPTLVTAILRGRALRMPATTTSSELKGLADMLGLPNPGNLLNVPVGSEKGPLGSILLLSPYSNRAWTSEDQSFLATISTSIVPILERLQRTGQFKQDSERAQSFAKDAADQTQRLKSANAELNNQLNEMKEQLNQTLAELGFQKQLLEEASQGAKSAPAAPANPQLENELRMALVEQARLQNQLAEANARNMDLQSKPAARVAPDQAEVVASISQELRQPMSSIIGYADLLLGESVGILGALQRKFIERIRTSTERIGSLVDDLIQITTLEAGLVSVKPKAVDLNIIIDNAMAYTSSQMREKNITLRIDIPDNLQPLYADQETLQQILIHLLQNAGAATPAEGSVTLRVRLQKENGQENVLLQVTDSGGGIPKDDLPRVFSRLYRAENPLIQGVGDTGVGLSIAKSLTEAHQGRIWVETQPGSGSTFNVSLPLATSVPLASPQGV